MHPWASRSGTAGSGCEETWDWREKERRTSVEGRGDGGDNYLDGEEGGHENEDIAVLVVDGMDAYDVDGWLKSQGE